MTPWDVAEPLDVIVLVPFIIAVIWLVLLEWRNDRRHRHAVSPKPRVVETPADAAPPVYLSAIGCLADSESGVGDSVEAREFNGTTQIRLVVKR